MRWVGHVACTGDRSCAYTVVVRRLDEKDHLEDLGVDGRIILKRSDVAQDKVTWRTLMRAIISLRAPYNAGNLLNSFGTNSLSRMTLLYGFSQSVS